MNEEASSCFGPGLAARRTQSFIPLHNIPSLLRRLTGILATSSLLSPISLDTMSRHSKWVKSTNSLKAQTHHHNLLLPHTLNALSPRLPKATSVCSRNRGTGALASAETLFGQIAMSNSTTSLCAVSACVAASHILSVTSLTTVATLG